MNLQPAQKGKSATFLRIRRQICLAGVSMGLAIQIKWIAGLGFSPYWRRNLILALLPVQHLMSSTISSTGNIVFGFREVPSGPVRSSKQASTNI